MTFAGREELKNREQDLILSKWMTFAGRKELKNINFLSRTPKKNTQNQELSRPIHYRSSSRITPHASISLSSDQAALAGLVDGRQTACLCVRGSVYFLYIFSAVFPFT